MPDKPVGESAAGWQGPAVADRDLFQARVKQSVAAVVRTLEYCRRIC